MKALFQKLFLTDVVNTTCYLMNRALIGPILNKARYELYFGRKPNISHFHIFGCKCYAHNNDKDNLDKFDSKFNEALFIGQSSSSKAFHVYNKRNLKIEESIYVVFYEFSLSDDTLREEKDQRDWINFHT